MADAARRAIPLLDLTSLNEGDDEAAILRLCERAETPQGPVAAVCVYPRFARLCRRRLEGTGIRTAAVANFPHGRADAEAAASEVREAIAEGAEEIDLVLPYAAWAAGERQPALELIAACREAASGVRLKTILETGRLPGPEAIRSLAEAAIAGGADFLKTSTGKTEVSATPEAARILLQAIRDSGRAVGFKAAGGIRTAADAAAYLGLADAIMGSDWARPETFRFGASALLDHLLASAAGGTAAGAREGY